jgi:hypothetical protein
MSRRRRRFWRKRRSGGVSGFKAAMKNRYGV